MLTDLHSSNEEKETEEEQGKAGGELGIQTPWEKIAACVEKIFDKSKLGLDFLDDLC